MKIARYLNTVLMQIDLFCAVYSVDLRFHDESFSMVQILIHPPYN